MILRDIIFTKEDAKCDNAFKIVLNLHQNCTMVLRHLKVELI